jgi:hypothetical protein
MTITKQNRNFSTSTKHPSITRFPKMISNELSGGVEDVRKHAACLAHAPAPIKSCAKITCRMRQILPENDALLPFAGEVRPVNGGAASCIFFSSPSRFLFKFVVTNLL